MSLPMDSYDDRWDQPLPGMPEPPAGCEERPEGSEKPSPDERAGLAPVLPSVVLDPFGGTGTTALVAHVLGRHGITVDMSADYCRLAAWRTTDPAQLERAARPPRATPARRLTVKKTPAKTTTRKATGPRIHPWDQPFPLFAEAAS